MYIYMYVYICIYMYIYIYIYIYICWPRRSGRAPGAHAAGSLQSPEVEKTIGLFTSP